MIRLIAFILLFALFIGFIVLNLDNKSDISFGIKTFTDIPVFLTVFTSFALGMLFAAPIILLRRRKRDIAIRSATAELMAPAEKKNRWLKSKNPPDESKKEESPYGID